MSSSVANAPVLSFKILDRFILKNLLDFFLLALVTMCLVVFFSDTFLDFLRDAQKLGITFVTGFLLIGLQFPKTIAFVLPACSFIAVLMVYHQFNQNFEIIAMRASGISLHRLLAPALALGIISSILCYVLGDYVVPYCNTTAERLMTDAVRNGQLPFGDDSVMFKHVDATNNLKQMIFIGKTQGHKLFNSTILDLSNPGALQVTQAKSGHWYPDRWEFETANAYTVSKKTNVLVFNHIDRFYIRNMFGMDAETEEDQAADSKSLQRTLAIDSDTQNFWQLLDIYQKRQAAGKPTVKKTIIKMWERITLPLASFFIILTAVPLALSAPRKRTDVGFVLAVAVLFGFYMLRAISIALGTSDLLTFGGMIPTDLALMASAWFPLLVIGGLGLYLVQKKNMVL